MAQPTRDELESRVARLSHELSSSRRAHVKTYDRLRSLEAAVVKHARMHECDCSTPWECLASLDRLTPKKPRKRLPWGDV